MKPHVLVVDDSLTIRMDLRAALCGAGFWVKTCSSLESARHELAVNSFDLVILDHLLPDGSGVELLQQIKESPELRLTRVIMLTTEAEISSRIQGLRLGADHYVGKPYDRDYLMRTARELFKLTDPGRISTSRRLQNTKKLLLVDDSPTFIHGLAMALRQDGHEVAMAYSGEDAVALLAVESFDGVLIDMVMPGINGVETCRRLRQIPGMDHSIVVLMTTSENPAWRAAALAAGADELIIKPRNLSLVTALLLGLFVHKRQQFPAGRTLVPPDRLAVGSG